MCHELTYSLQERAASMLAKEAALEVELCLRIEEHPSFEPSTVLCLCRVGETTYRVLERTWDMETDARRAKERVEWLEAKPARHLLQQEELQPTLRRRWADLPADVADELLAALRGAKLSMPPEPEALGMDGTSYTLYYEAGFSSAELCWWEAGPEEWQDLVEVAMKVFAVFRDATKDVQWTVEDASGGSSGED